MRSALVTRSTSMLSRIAHPTQRRDARSSTVAKYRKPSRVGTYVMSPTHTRFSATPLMSNARASRFGAMGSW
jgi:hypothetical protein